MSENTKIEWAGHSWNPIRVGPHRWYCEKISPGCDNCYASTFNHRMGGEQYPAVKDAPASHAERPMLDLTVLGKPSSWGRPDRIFVCSMTDLFGEWVPFGWINAVFVQMVANPRHTFQVLTKRPRRMLEFLDWRREWLASMPSSLGVPVWPQNAWPGVTIESDRYVWRADLLRAVGSDRRWISAEPLLDGLPSLDLRGIHWLVAGGESGHGARPMHPDWARGLRDRCADAGAAYFFKQHGEWLGYTEDAQPPFWDSASDGSMIDGHQLPDGIGDGELVNGWRADLGLRDRAAVYHRVGKKAAGRLLDGREHNDYPDVAPAAVRA